MWELDSSKRRLPVAFHWVLLETCQEKCAIEVLRYLYHFCCLDNRQSSQIDFQRTDALASKSRIFGLVRYQWSFECFDVFIILDKWELKSRPCFILKKQFRICIDFLYFAAGLCCVVLRACFLSSCSNIRN